MSAETGEAQFSRWGGEAEWFSRDASPVERRVGFATGCQERRRSPFLLVPGVGCFARIQRAMPGAAAPVAGWGRRGCGIRINNRITTGIRAFMARDWQRAWDFKDAYWVERIERLGPLEGLRIAGELRQQAILANPDWPDAKSRREDLDSHIRLADLFARADTARRA